MKKILSLAMVGVMMFSALPMAYATNTYENPTNETAMGTAVEYVANSDANRAYTITVPAKLVPKQDAAVSGTVTLKGKWASNETVKVTADAEVELTNSINAEDKHKLAITFNTMEYAGDNTEEKTYTETVSVAAMPAAALFGEWTGKFNYNVEFDDGREPSLLKFDKLYARTDNSGTENDSWLKFSENGVLSIYSGSTDSTPTTLSNMSYDGENVYGPTGTLSHTVSADGKTVTVLPSGKTFTLVE